MEEQRGRQQVRKFHSLQLTKFKQKFYILLIHLLWHLPKTRIAESCSNVLQDSRNGQPLNEDRTKQGKSNPSNNQNWMFPIQKIM